jgi:hypothetical protein
MQAQATTRGTVIGQVEINSLRNQPQETPSDGRTYAGDVHNSVNPIKIVQSLSALETFIDVLDGSSILISLLSSSAY